MKDKARIGKTNKKKGSDGERLYAQIFRNLGYNFCRTSRQASRIHDDAGIDLVEIPFNVQIKVGYDRGINYKTILSYMKEKIIELFSPTHESHRQVNMVIHRKSVGKGKKRNEFDDLVIMSFEDFKKLINNNES